MFVIRIIRDESIEAIGGNHRSNAAVVTITEVSLENLQFRVTMLESDVENLNETSYKIGKIRQAIKRRVIHKRLSKEK